MKNFMLEGKPGVGKTTLILNIAALIGASNPGGFYAREIREEGARIGFLVENLSGLSGFLSHVDYNTGPRVGKYHVDIGSFEKVAVKSLEHAIEESGVILIDEIGRMELFSRRFKELVIECFDSPKDVVSTVMSKSHPFVDSLKARPDVILLNVTEKNRNELAVGIAGQIT